MAHKFRIDKAKFRTPYQAICQVVPIGMQLYFIFQGASHLITNCITVNFTRKQYLFHPGTFAAIGIKKAALSHCL